MSDRESWLSSVLPKDGDAEREHASLLATAALVRGSVQAIPVAEAGESASLDRCVAMFPEQFGKRRARPVERAPERSGLGSWLRVVFTLWRRR